MGLSVLQMKEGTIKFKHGKFDEKGTNRRT